jgi:hypothetical protein
LITPGEYRRVPVRALEGSKWVETAQRHFRALGINWGSAVDNRGQTTNDIADLPDPIPSRPANYTRYLTVATLMKNQRRWLREWLEFHILVGVEHFLIYDNDSSDEPLDVLQGYIDEGIVTFIPWPPAEFPQPFPATTVLEQWQDGWFRDALDTCIQKSWTIHQQGPCQVAAFIDAIWKTRNGTSRWLGIWDVDEFMFPPNGSHYPTLSATLRGAWPDHTTVRVWGNVYGTSGHVHPARRAEGSPLQALVTEEYTYRSELDRISFKSMLM